MAVYQFLPSAPGEQLFHSGVLGIYGNNRICGTGARIWREISNMAAEEIESMEIDLEEKQSASTTITDKGSTSTEKKKGFQLPW